MAAAGSAPEDILWKQDASLKELFGESKGQELLQKIFNAYQVALHRFPLYEPAAGSSGKVG